MTLVVGYEQEITNKPFQRFNSKEYYVTLKS